MCPSFKVPNDHTNRSKPLISMLSKLLKAIHCICMRAIVRTAKYALYKAVQNA